MKISTPVSDLSIFGNYIKMEQKVKQIERKKKEKNRKEMKTERHGSVLRERDKIYFIDKQKFT